MMAGIACTHLLPVGRADCHLLPPVGRADCHLLPRILSTTLSAIN